MKAKLIELGTEKAPLLIVKEITANHFSTPFHFHDYCELNYVKKSFGKRIVGDSIQQFNSGDLVLMSPNLPHIWFNDPEVFTNPRTKNAQAIVTYFSMERIGSLISDPITLAKFNKLFKEAACGLQIKGKTGECIKKRLEQLMEKKGLQKIIDFLVIIDILLHSREYEPLANLGYSHSYNYKDTERMNIVYQYIMKNFKEEITLSDVSRVANLTPPAFCNFFKKRTQKSFTRFLNDIRIGHACQLLNDESLSISTVCYESGYQNFANFNKFFKDITGKTPTQYRKELLLTIVSTR
ncbi:AraC family transcriptional regulator [Flavihumibacter sp. UBA7668]|uniref:AraC family transcriptional regulator n=1 Tax=Flavihumibacter sp. UBA7668 TaxID=1946542 RepID=UPI0025C3FBB5|nr:AraC family transcriptional regulator [Flavihumibacter sp. UBA7668]